MPSFRAGGLAVFVLCALSVCPAGAQVKVKIGVDGQKVIFNESSTQRARRLSDRLMPVPDVALEPIIDRHSAAQNLDPRLVRALIQAESGYNPRALSNKGAIGLMQLMPATATSLRVSDPWNIEENLRGGTTYLRKLLDRFAGSLELAVAAYNAGPRAVERHGGVPPYRETRAYVRRVIGLYRGASVAPQARITTSSRRAVPPAPAPTFDAGRRKPRLIRNSDNQLVITTALD